MLQQKLEANTGFSSGGLEETFVPLNRSVQNALQDLGTSIVYRRRVPGFPASPTFPTSSSINTEPRSPRAPIADINDSTIPTYAGNRSTRPISIIIPPIGTLQPQSHQSHSPTTIAPEPRLPSSGISININNDLLSQIESMHSPLPEIDFLAVHENSDLLHLDPSANYQAEAGYITTTSGPLFTTAKLDENLSENLITQSFAITHGLHIELIDADENTEDGIWVQIGAGKKERCIGKVRLEWGIGADSWKPEFPVHCWVCVHGAEIGDLVFGRRFVEKKEHYWKQKVTEVYRS